MDEKLSLRKSFEEDYVKASYDKRSRSIEIDTTYQTDSTEIHHADIYLMREDMEVDSDDEDSEI